MARSTLATVKTEPNRGFWTSFSGIFARSQATLVLQSTAIVLVYRGFDLDAELLNVLVAIVGILFLLSEELLMRRSLWLFLFCCMAATIAMQWESTPNHCYFMAYWMLACGLAVGSKDTQAVLAHNARWMIGLSMAFSVVWKLRAGEYFDGAFFHSAFLTYGFFEWVPGAVGGLNEQQVAMNHSIWSAFRNLPPDQTSATLYSSPTLNTFAQAVSHGALVIEGLVTLTILSKVPRFLFQLRDWFLMAFLATAYWLAPIDRFAFALTILGLAQCDWQNPRHKWLYLAIFCFLVPVIVSTRYWR